jgi:hypothetical protein
MNKTKNIIAKSVLPNKYWILESNGQKIGTIQAIDDGGFSLVNNGKRKKYATITTLKHENNIFFDNKRRRSNSDTSNLLGNYPISGNAHNIIWNIKKRFAAYTKSKSSKCHYCAGYFVVIFHSEWQIMFCPKLIMINRYEFKGPFKSLSDAEKALKNGTEYNITHQEI